MRFLLVNVVCFVALSLAAPYCAASGDARAAFAEKAFPAATPSLSSLWLNAELKTVLLDKFDFSAHQIRMRYWQQGERTAWVLEEVGKEKPITMGVIVENRRIVDIDVLVYRESRGEEIRYPFFRKQFYGAELTEKRKRLSLTENIDGITGATLSVRAMEKVAKVALFLHQTVNTASE